MIVFKLGWCGRLLVLTASKVDYGDAHLLWLGSSEAMRVDYKLGMTKVLSQADFHTE